jgi:hypothetical protein
MKRQETKSTSEINQMVERLTLCNSDFSDLSYLCALAAVQACQNSNIGCTHYFARRVPPSPYRASLHNDKRRAPTCSDAIRER